jgi:hypothetical protein
MAAFLEDLALPLDNAVHFYTHNTKKDVFGILSAATVAHQQIGLRIERFRKAFDRHRKKLDDLLYEVMALDKKCVFVRRSRRGRGLCRCQLPGSRNAYADQFGVFPCC